MARIQDRGPTSRKPHHAYLAYMWAPEGRFNGSKQPAVAIFNTQVLRQDGKRRVWEKSGPGQCGRAWFQSDAARCSDAS